MARVKFAPESGRFYTSTGDPVLEVDNSSKPGETRLPTVSDAVKNNWYPSVTEVIKTMSRAGLEAWKQDHMLDIALANPFPEAGNPPIDAWPPDRIARADIWKALIFKLSEEYASAAAERGKEIHADIENYFSGTMPVDPASEAACNMLGQRYSGWRTIPSFRFVNAKQGYAGEMDLLVLNSAKVETATVAIVSDIKTKDVKTFSKPSIDYGLQVGAYMQYLRDYFPQITQLTGENIIVDRQTGETLPFVWGEKWKRTQSQTADQLSRGFLCLLGLWFITNNYRPPA